MKITASTTHKKCKTPGLVVGTSNVCTSMQQSCKINLEVMNECASPLNEPQKHVIARFYEHIPSKQTSFLYNNHLLFSKEAMIVTKVDQSLVIDRKAAETISHCKALKTNINICS